MDRYATLRHGLVGAWCPSLRTGGRILEDRSNRRVNGLLQGGATWSAAALSLASASQQYASVWDSATVAALSSGELSVTAWIRPSSVSVLQCPVSTIAGAGNNCTFSLEIGRTSGKVTLLQNGASVDATSTALLTANAWSLVGFTRQGTTGAWTIRLIIGNAIETSTTAVNPTSSTPGSLSIGRAGDFTASAYFNGLIDDVRIWNRPLTSAEIRILQTGRGVGLVPTRHRRAKVLGSQFWLNVSGAWKKATPFIKVAGEWEQATPKLNVTGTWK